MAVEVLAAIAKIEGGGPCSLMVVAECDAGGRGQCTVPQYKGNAGSCRSLCLVR